MRAEDRHGRVLLVEDEPDVLLILAAVLADAGHVVEAVSTCQDAASLLADPKCFDLLVTDLALEDGDGEDLMALAMRRGMPYVAITGNPERLPVGARLVDGHPMLAKPFRPDCLIAAVDRALGQP